MDDREFYDLEGELLTAKQLEFLAALRRKTGDRVRPCCGGLTDGILLLVLDVDAPDVALVDVGLELRDSQLHGDRMSVHDRSFPPSPTPDGFVLEGSPDELASRGGDLLERFADRSIVRHEWLHRGKVYADCDLFEDSGEGLSQSYRSDWAPSGQERRLEAGGFAHGRGWIQTEGLGAPDRVVHIRGVR